MEKERLLSFLEADPFQVAFIIAKSRLMRKFIPKISQKIVNLLRLDPPDIEDQIFSLVCHIPEMFLRDVMLPLGDLGADVYQRVIDWQSKQENFWKKSLDFTLLFTHCHLIFISLVDRIHERLTVDISTRMKVLESLECDLDDSQDERTKESIIKIGDSLFEEIMELGDNRIREFNNVVRMIIIH